jgi:hypothetical protein
VVCQQAQNRGIEGRHSPAGEQRTQCVSRHKMEGPRVGTHFLESRGHGVLAGTKRRDQGQALTSWRAEDVVCQQVQNRGTEGRHSLPGEQRTWCVSRCQMERPRAGTHRLKSRGCNVSAGTKWRDQGQALTNWRAEDVVCQQVQNRGTEGRHSLPREQRTWCVSRHKMEGLRAGTHSLESRGCGVSQQAQNRGTEGRHSLPGEQRTQCVRRHKTEEPRADTHFLESRGCGVSGGAKWRD